MIDPAQTSACFAEIEKNAATQHLVGAGLGALAGGYRELQKTRAADRVVSALADAGKATPEQREHWKARRALSVGLHALGGGALGTAAGHLAPHALASLKTHSGAAAEHIGKHMGAGMSSELNAAARANARDVGREIGRGTAEGAGRAVKENTVDKIRAWFRRSPPPAP